MKSGRRCPVCKKPTAVRPGQAPFPFCSDRCRLLDLDNWLGGRYVVRSEAPFDEAGDALPVEEIPEEWQ